MNSKRKETRKLYGILIAIMIFVFAGNAVIVEAKEEDAGVNPYAQSVEEQTTEFYVNDFANLFTEEQKNSIIEKAAQLEKETGGIQVVITTVDTWGEGRIGESYTHAMYNQYEIGEKSMGILITFSKEEGEILFETGKNMQIFITDAQINDLLDEEAMEALRTDIAEGLMLLQDDIIEEIRQTVPENWYDQFPSSESVASEELAVTPKQTSNNSIFIGMLVVLVLLIIILLIIAYKLKMNLDLSKSSQKKLQRKLDRLNNEFEEHKKEAKISLECAEKETEVKLKKMQEKLNILNTQYEVLSQWYERAKMLYPDIEAQIEIMIENEFKDKAAEVDKEIQKCINLEASPSHIETFQNAIRFFEALDDNAKRYITSDIKRLYKYFEKSISMKEQQEKEEAREIATSARVQIKCIMDRCSVGNIETYEDLKSAYNIYEKLSKLQKSVFPDAEMIRNLQKLILDAKMDCQDMEVANNAMKKIEDIVSGINSADMDNLDKLQKAHKLYKSLSDKQKSYFDNDLIDKLNKLIKQSEEDQEREARRMRDSNALIMSGSMRYGHTYTPIIKTSGYSGTNRSSGGTKSGSSLSSSRPSNSSATRASSRSAASRPTTSHKVTGRGGKGSGNTIKRKL